jgi:hypothetical protein
LLKVRTDYRCPHCRRELDHRQVNRAKWLEWIGRALLFFMLCSVVAVTIVWMVAQDMAWALGLGVIIGAASGALLWYVMRERDL